MRGGRGLSRPIRRVDRRRGEAERRYLRGDITGAVAILARLAVFSGDSSALGGLAEIRDALEALSAADSAFAGAHGTLRIGLARLFGHPGFQTSRQPVE